jgi:hypothetical protein
MMMTDPLIPVGKKGLDDVARSLLEEQEPPVVEPPKDDPDPKPRYIELPARNCWEEGLEHDYHYPATLVSIARSRTGMSWNEAQADLHKNGAFMLTPRQFVDFLRQLRSLKPVYDEHGRIVDHNTRAEILLEILDPVGSAGEHLDTLIARPKQHWYGLTSKDFTLRYHVVNDDGSVEAKSGGIRCFSGDDFLFSLDDWLKTRTWHGMPPHVVPEAGDIKYISPSRDLSAVAFSRHARTCFSANTDPAWQYGWISVREAKLKK